MSGHKHLDGTAYWQQAFQKSELAQAQLVDRIYELEHEKDSNLQKSDFAETSLAGRGKRKRDSEAAQPQKANSQAKRRAASSQKALPSLNDMPSLPKSESFASNTITTTKETFLRHVFRLRQSLNNRILDNDAIAMTFSETCHTMVCLINELIQSCTVKPARGKPSAKVNPLDLDAASLAIVLETAFPSLYLAIAKISNTTKSKSHLDSMVVSMARLFRDTLSAISELFTIQTQESVDAERRVARSRTSRPRAAKKQDTSQSKTSQDTAHLLAKFLQYMLRTLDLEQETQNELFEAYSCILLDHIGQSLSLQVFTEDAALVPHNAHPRLVQPKHLEALQNGDVEVHQRATLRQSPIFIHLLSHLTELITARQSLMSTKSPPLFGIRHEPLASQQSLADRVKSKLQNTLMQGVFGEDEVAFRNSLRIPEACASPIQAPKPNEEAAPPDNSEWFIGEVWRMLGWDTLKNFALDSKT